MRKIVGIYLSIRSSFKLINLRGKFDMNKCYKSSFTILKMCKYKKKILSYLHVRLK